MNAEEIHTKTREFGKKSGFTLVKLTERRYQVIQDNGGSILVYGDDKKRVSYMTGSIVYQGNYRKCHEFLSQQSKCQVPEHYFEENTKSA